MLCIVLTNGILSGEYGVPIYLMGNKNTIGSSIIMLILFSLIYVEIVGKKVEKKIMFIILIGSVTIVYTWSATSIVALAIINPLSYG